MDLLRCVARGTEALVGFTADCVTIAIGVIALWAFYFHRNKLSAVIELFVNTYLSQRIQRTKETLGRLEALTFDNKDHRPEIFALLGQLSGQIKSMAAEHKEVAAPYGELRELLEHRVRVTEAVKRRIVFEVHGALDGAYFGRTKELMKDHNEH